MKYRYSADVLADYYGDLTGLGDGSDHVQALELFGMFGRNGLLPENVKQRGLPEGFRAGEIGGS